MPEHMQVYFGQPCFCYSTIESVPEPGETKSALMTQPEGIRQFVLRDTLTTTVVAKRIPEAPYGSLVWRTHDGIIAVLLHTFRNSRKSPKYWLINLLTLGIICRIILTYGKTS